MLPRLKRSARACLSLCFAALMIACASLRSQVDEISDPEAVVHTLRSEHTTAVLELTIANLHRELPFYPDRRQLYMRLLNAEQPLLLYSPLGIRLSGADFTHSLKIENITRSPLLHDYALAHGKTTRVKKKAELFRVALQNSAGQNLTLEVVMQADAVALRYVIPGSGTVRVEQELTGFRLPAGAPAVMQQYQEASKVSPAYEYYYERTNAGASDDGKASIRRIWQPVVGFTGLVIFGSDGWAMPALFEPQKGKYILLAEAGTDERHAAMHLANPEHNLYTLALPAEKEGNGVGASSVTGQLPYATAYRVILCCDLKAIAESTAITDLSAPLDKRFAGRLPQWVRPGKASWDWLSYVSTGDAERQKKYIDAAHEFGWQYTLIDANWNKWNNNNAEPIVRELVSYAQKKNIGLWLWYNSGGPNNTVTEEPRDLMHNREVRRSEFAKLKSWGIKGVKIDFWQSDKQAMMQQYIETLEDAADYELMVNFHGCTMPRGWQRRFPHLMTMEAVKGAEWYQFPVFRGPAPRDHVFYALTRNVVGPMDFTPIVFAQALKQQNASYSHSLALAVVFESGVQHFADKADDTAQGYRKVFAQYPFVQEFLRIVPVHWDETRLLSADPDSHVVFARRSGKDWFVGAISAAKHDLDLDVRLETLQGQSYEQWTISEGATPDSFQESRTTWTKPASLKLKLRPMGGAVIRFKPL